MGEAMAELAVFVGATDAFDEVELIPMRETPLSRSAIQSR